MRGYHWVSKAFTNRRDQTRTWEISYPVPLFLTKQGLPPIRLSFSPFKYLSGFLFILTDGCKRQTHPHPVSASNFLEFGGQGCECGRGGDFCVGFFPSLQVVHPCLFSPFSHSKLQHLCKQQRDGTGKLGNSFLISSSTPANDPRLCSW